ncbi:MAG: alpha/beta hydrolase [Candidatus Aenigmarchaeota archaeon]|nr:alpha/beta hydrolase [Candidatus Aenigmarchaeota archaeon]
MKKLLFLLLVAAVLLSGCTSPQDSYSVSQDGFLSYTNRPAVNYTQTLLKEDENVSMYKLTFESRGQKIYALFAIPRNSPKSRNGKIPGIFILYGATMNKEGEWGGMGKDLAEMGFAVLIIDQRGWGETDGFVPTMESDYQTFANGGEPVQHKMVYDGLRCYDILKSRPEIDGSRIYASGESMGGRYAIIASSIEKGIAGDLIISSSGYGFQQNQDPQVMRFLDSIDPNHYVAGISPRPLVMMHSRNDNVVPFDLGKATFEKAGEPKKFLVTEGVGHSYVRADMKELIEKELKDW